MKDTILIDFDGVIRHWSGNEIEGAELISGVEKGSLLSVAFAPEYLSPVIVGEVSHEEWVVNVEDALGKKYGKRVALELICSWNNASWEIDKELIKEIRGAAPQCKLVLVTNATSKLTSDLVRSGLKSEFDIIVNSADIGSAKPSFAFYKSSLSMANTTAKKSIFIDDSLSNVEAAVSIGIDSIRHMRNSDTLKFIRQKCT